MCGFITYICSSDTFFFKFQQSFCRYGGETGKTSLHLSKVDFLHTITEVFELLGKASVEQHFER